MNRNFVQKKSIHLNLPIVYSFIVIIFSESIYCHLPSSNLTENPFCAPFPGSIASDWFCLDFFISNYVGENGCGTIPCRCFLNIQCSPLVNEAQDHLMFWLSCSDLPDSNILNQFLQTLPQNLIEHSKKEVSKCIQMNDNMISLRTEFSGCNKNDIFEFIKQVENQEPKHYVLEYLDITESDLDEIPIWLFQKFNNLKSLNLTGNKLSQFGTDRNLSNYLIHPSNLITIDLSKNQLTRVDLSHFFSLKSINLSQNNLTTLSKNNLPEDMINLLENMKADNIKTLIDLSIGNNPWNCNDDIDWLINLISAIVETNGRAYFYEYNGNMNSHNQHRLELFQTNEPECNSPSEAKMFPFSVWKSVKESPICEQCSCYLKDKYAKVGYRYVIVNCTNRNLISLPMELPKNTKIFDLSNNHIRNLNPLNKFHGQLSKWRHVNKIILSNNSLETLDGLDLIRSIVFLDISGNLLTEIPYHIINKVLSSKIDKFRIGNNPYICDCNTVKMQKWLQNNYRIILDIKQVRCGYLRWQLAQNEYYSSMVEQARNNKFYNKEILHINSLHLCPSGDSIDLLDVINVILAALIFLLIIKVTYDFCWQKKTGKLPLFFKLNI